MSNLKPETKLRRALQRLVNAVENYANERHFGAGGGVDGDDEMATTDEARAVDRAVYKAIAVLADTKPPRRYRSVPTSGAPSPVTQQGKP